MQNYNKNVLDKLTIPFPLHSIAIELTNRCNLKCIHCFGKFGLSSDTKMYTFEEIVKLKEELDKLHTMEVRLTGGECFLNPEFPQIAQYFLDNGFSVTIYTNGVLTDKIIEFAEVTKKYHYNMGISLDGVGDLHNRIRGNQNAFENVMTTLKNLKEYSNIEVFIETALMKQNINGIADVRRMCKEQFPEYEHQLTITTPVDGVDFSLSLQEISDLKAQYPDLFDRYFSEKKRLLFQKKRHRCQGGVGSAALTADGILKICPLASENCFVIGDIKQATLSKVWMEPSDSVKMFRAEYVKSTPQCKRCKAKRRCGNMNCRVEALRLTGNCENANPYTCTAIKGQYDS